MTKEYGVGIIGCGNISGAYFKLVPIFNNLRVVSCADINPAAAEARATEFGVKAETIDALLANAEVDVFAREHGPGDIAVVAVDASGLLAHQGAVRVEGVIEVDVGEGGLAVVG